MEHAFSPVHLPLVPLLLLMVALGQAVSSACQGGPLLLLLLRPLLQPLVAVACAAAAAAAEHHQHQKLPLVLVLFLVVHCCHHQLRLHLSSLQVVLLPLVLGLCGGQLERAWGTAYLLCSPTKRQRRSVRGRTCSPWNHNTTAVERPTAADKQEQ